MFGVRILVKLPQQQRHTENTAGLWRHHPNLKGIKHAFVCVCVFVRRQGGLAWMTQSGKES